MAENAATPVPEPPKGVTESHATSAAATLGSATYEIIRQRLQKQGSVLQERLALLDSRRQEVFGSVGFELLQSDRITTAHNCVPRDMVPLGHDQFLFGFNVQFGLKKEVDLADVFAVYDRDKTAGTFKEGTLDCLKSKEFISDFKRLYNVYDKATFSKFSLIEGSLYMVFRIGTGPNDNAVFKWSYNDGKIRFLDGRSESEFRRVGSPPSYEFRWLTPPREAFRYGDHPHISIEDRVFVECVGGDLTIKVEDNTKTGEGIYSEPVDDKFQKVDDSEVAYGIVNHLVLLRIRPYKETAYRFFIFNQKLQTVHRVDSLGHSCVLLPEDHGLIFPDGYYLASGDLKLFAGKETGLTIERVIHSPNGEDSLYVFYNRDSGEYVLLPYRLIAQKVEERIACHGFSLFPDGHLLLFRADDEPQKHHQIQLRQTPFYQPGHEPAGKRDAFLFKVGNKQVVRALAECHEVLTLIRKENPYSELYVDLVKRTSTIADSYPWLSSEEGFQIVEALRQVREVSDKAVDEFDKVRRLQREALQRVQEIASRCEERFRTVRRASFASLDDYVHNLTALRQLRGELITLKEVRYVDAGKVTELENSVTGQTEELSKASVQFLLQPTALEGYRTEANRQLEAVDKVQKSTEAREIEKAVSQSAKELEMLIETVNTLRIEDPTVTTRIIDGITAIYSTLNQVRSALKKRLQELSAVEGAAQFDAQMKLLSQSAASYLDLCDSPAKCEEYLNRISVQLEEIEGAFADHEEYTVQLAEKRTSLYETFEQRKVALIEQRNKKAAALMTAAERILKVIQNRLAGFKTVEEINTYMASDLMIAKVRDIIAQLLALEDSVKADDLQGRVKSIQQESVRQLKDRQELFAGGASLIQLGRHRFNTNTQALDLTVVIREGIPYLHLTSTKYFDAITDEEFLATKAIWAQELVSESPEVYRGEFLAYQLLREVEIGGTPPPSALLGLSEEERLEWVQKFMVTRFQEGYTKGLHDVDGSRIFHALLKAYHALGLARFHPSARACGLLFWHRFCPEPTRTLWARKVKGISARNKLFPGQSNEAGYIDDLEALIRTFLEQTKLFSQEHSRSSAQYLFEELIAGETFAVTKETHDLIQEFRQHLVTSGSETAFEDSLTSLKEHPESEFNLIREWVRGFTGGRNGSAQYLDETAAVLFCGRELQARVVEAASSSLLEGMKGAHPVIRESKYAFSYLEFRQKLEIYCREVVPLFERFHALKSRLVEKERKQLRLHDFKPRVLSSFVRNQLIDEVYLPIVGDNLAKQIGAAGDQKRTDLMGLLLLISPPGYGKTTLVEYIANRLGIIFVKINGPALGHQVTSLDPQQAPNAAAREEINKLNLAFEMGDNVMLCVDDIQHCHPEFLQKFISLCDGQRRIEGVWRGHPRTYDLRGRKVVVVMAGNPYTESGQKFKIPDMLSNRADTYNLGDIVGGNADWFKSSYLENAITSNVILAPLANKSQKDVRSFIRMAAGGERDAEGFEGSYSNQEIEEVLAVLKKLVAVRDVVLKVNQEYIHSAGQADEFRTEPPFKLQGSYRNMNRLAEKIVPIMNDAEVRSLILDHYQNEAQTLTTGAEANLLKLRELLNIQTPGEKARWEEIKKTFARNQVMRGVDHNDPMGRVVAQLSSFQSGLEGIQQVLARQLDKPASSVQVDLSSLAPQMEAIRKTLEEKLMAPQGLPKPAEDPVAQGIRSLRDDLRKAIGQAQTVAMPDRVQSLSHEMEMLHSTLATLKDLAAQHRDHLKATQELMETRARQGTVEFELTQEMLINERAFLDRFHSVLADAQRANVEGAVKPPVDPAGPTDKNS